MPRKSGSTRSCACRCRESNGLYVRIEELDRCVAMASEALQAKTRHFEAEETARIAVEQELLRLRSKLQLDKECLVDDETSFIRSQVKYYHKEKVT